VADIGLDCGSARAWLVEEADVVAWAPPRAADAHKWRAACWLVAGSPPMPGAATLAARACARAGAGYVRLSTPGAAGAGPTTPVEVVSASLPAHGWAAAALDDDIARFKAAVIGPGLGRAPETDVEVRRFVAGAPVPVVVDGDALGALGERAAGIVASRGAPTVLTPHDGEFERLAGHPPGPDRLAEARSLAAATGAVVLLKGPTTVVAGPDGTVLLSVRGDARLATAGTGDVLSGVIGALLAQGVEPLRAAAGGALLHGCAAALGPARGLVAGDVADRLPAAWGALSEAAAAAGRRQGRGREREREEP
jgi:NAD(P)H-hydrate epimerase